MFKIVRFTDAEIVAGDLVVTVKIQISKAAVGRWLTQLLDTFEFVPTWKEED